MAGKQGENKKVKKTTNMAKQQILERGDEQEQNISNSRVETEADDSELSRSARGC